MKNSHHSLDQNTINCLVYIGMPDNPQFLGPQDPQELAAHVLRSSGPSGPNREYLYLLEEALLSLSPESKDGHISDLAKRARALEAEGGWEEPKQKVEVELYKIGSTKEQEEVEKAV
jgi:glutathione-specific gamma-glutamylcyclotransferase